MDDQEENNQEPEERSRTAGGCVLIGLTAAATAVLFRASLTAGILTLWTVGTVAVWRAARRRKGSDQPLPSPTERGSHTDLDLHEARKAARVATDPNAVMRILHPAGHEVDAT